MIENIPKIERLQESVINRIAAGEVVQKPSAALKELLENSIDAKSTAITITVKGGGLELLQITDNGHGIRKEDLSILCERFTTSKLSKFDDLKTIQTFGFRGEALSSITHVANVTITTKTNQSNVAYKTIYCDGKVKIEPKACAGMTGTTICVENLFYNMPTRRQAFKNLNEQYNKILDVVSKYSIHFGNRKIAFTCKRSGQLSPDLQTSNSNSILDNIKLIFGSQVAKELVDFECSVDIPSPSSSSSAAISTEEVEILNSINSSSTSKRILITGKMSNANYSAKKPHFILFINNRLVECQSFKKVVDSVFSTVLPKHTFPFVYLSLEMPPQILDVNIHPTKKEVRFLYEDEILLKLHDTIRTKLLSSSCSRSYNVTAVLPMQFSLSKSSCEESLNANSDRLDNDYYNDNSDFMASNSESFESQALNPIDGLPSQSSDYIISDRSERVSSENDQIVRSQSNVSDNDEVEWDEQVRFRDPISNPIDSLDQVVSDDEFGIAFGFSGPKNESIQSTNERLASSGVMSSTLKGRTDKPKLPSTTRSSSTSSNLPANKLVRSDFRLQRIDSFFKTAPSSQLSNHDTVSAIGNDIVSNNNDQVDAVNENVNEEDAELFCVTAKQFKRFKRSKSSIVGDLSEGRNNHIENQNSEGMSSQCPCCPVLPFTIGSKRTYNDEIISNGLPLLDISSNSGLNTDNNQDYSPIPICETNSSNSFKEPYIYSESIALQDLRTEIFELMHPGLTQVVRQHVFVGAVDLSLSLIQYQTQLFLVNHQHLLRHFFYQRIILLLCEYLTTQDNSMNLSDLHAFPRLKFSNPISVRKLLENAINNPRSRHHLHDKKYIDSCDESKRISPVKVKLNQDFISKSLNVLAHYAEMLSEYFSLRLTYSQSLSKNTETSPPKPNFEVDDLLLESLPDLVPSYDPSTSELPYFMYRLVSVVPWYNNNEKECLRSVAQEIAFYFSIQQVTKSMGNSDSKATTSNEVCTDQNEILKRDLTSVDTCLSQLLFPNMMKYLIPTKQFIDDNTFIQVAALEQLYKVFERC